MQITGVVEQGNQWARTIGVPTANVRFEPPELFKAGTYTAQVLIDDETYPAAAYCDNQRGHWIAEAHLFDFDQDIYGKEITIDLLEHIAGVHPFTDEETMISKIHADIANTKSALDLN